jgi:hypothetical protein
MLVSAVEEVAEDVERGEDEPLEVEVVGEDGALSLGVSIGTSM